MNFINNSKNPDVLLPLRTIDWAVLFFAFIFLFLLLMEYIVIENAKYTFLFIIPLMITEIKYWLIAKIYKKNSILFLQKVSIISSFYNPLLQLVIFGMFLILLFSTETILKYYIVCMITVGFITQISFIGIFPQGVITNRSFYKWDKIQFVSWDKEESKLTIQLKPTMFIFTFDNKKEWIIPEEKKSSIDGILKIYFDSKNIYLPSNVLTKISNS